MGSVSLIVRRMSCSGIALRLANRRRRRAISKKTYKSLVCCNYISFTDHARQYRSIARLLIQLSRGSCNLCYFVSFVLTNSWDCKVNASRFSFSGSILGNSTNIDSAIPTHLKRQGVTYGFAIHCWLLPIPMLDMQLRFQCSHVYLERRFRQLKSDLHRMGTFRQLNLSFICARGPTCFDW